MSLFETFKKSLGLEEQQIEEFELQPENSLETPVAEPHNVLQSIDNVNSEPAKDLQLKEWARQKVIQDWKAKAAKGKY